jgi:acetyltransferase-like isoleucine patch superfamily enzyme
LVRQVILLGNFSGFVGRNSAIKFRSKILSQGFLKIGSNCTIDALSIDGLDFGKNNSIGDYTTVLGSGTYANLGIGLKTGENVGIGSYNLLGCAGGIEIGSDTIFGNFVSLHSENHNYADREIPIRLQGVSRKGIVIGSKATILDGVTLGNRTIVAAGSVVVEGCYPGNIILGGVPAKVIKNI